MVDTRRTLRGDAFGLRNFFDVVAFLRGLAALAAPKTDSGYLDDALQISQGWRKRPGTRSTTAISGAR